MSHTTQIRQVDIGSWFSPDSSRRLCAELSDKLIERFKGKKGVFLTLTYDRAPYSSPVEVYRDSGTERHVRLFIRSLGKMLGENLSGKWICKLEFQRGDWPHFHLLIETSSRPTADQVSRAWGHGFVHVARIRTRRLRYFAKYVAKPGALAGWVLAERTRSVKVIRTSPGFWPVSRKAKPSSAIPCKRHPPTAYVTLGDKLARTSTVLIRSGRRFRRFRLAYHEAVTLLASDRACFGNRCGAWTSVDRSFDAVQALLGTEEDKARGEAAVNLIQTSKPHNHPEWMTPYLISIGVLEWGSVSG